jgi:hypothetical protein
MACAGLSIAAALVLPMVPALSADVPAPAKNPAAKPAAPLQQSITPVPWTPVLLRTVVTPQPFAGGDGKTHIIYDVVLNNFDSSPSSILRLEVLNGQGKILRSFGTNDFTRELIHLDHPNQSAVIPPGGTAVLLINLTFDKESDVPDIIRHRISTWTEMFSGQRKSELTYEGAPLVVDRRAPVVIGPPLTGGNWVCFGGYASPRGHRSALLAVDNRLQSAECYAMDWVKLAEQQRSNVVNDNKKVDNPSYGQPVLAVADGTISGIKNGLPDQPANKLEGTDRFDFPEGNAVVEDIGNSLYALYAHLQPGSLKVKEGQRVKKGQVIALVGNSGNTTSAHFQFQVMDGPHPIASNGVPFLLDDFTVVGELHPGMVERTSTGKPPSMENSRFTGEHKQQLPQDGFVVLFR